MTFFYQMYILDSTNGLRGYALLHALLKKAEMELAVQMPTYHLIKNAISIGSHGAWRDIIYLWLLLESYIKEPQNQKLL